MRKRSWSPSRMRGPGDADFAGGTYSRIPTAAIYSSGSGWAGRKVPLLLLCFSPSPSPTPPGWNMKVEIFIEEEFLKASTLVRMHSYSFIRTFIPSASIY